MSKESLRARSGSCLCAAVKYEVRGDPSAFGICHCINCRKATGSAFMSNGFFLQHQVRVVKGQDKLKVFRDRNTASDVPLDRHFCTDCGSNVFLQTTNPDFKDKFFVVALGTLDDEIHWSPNKEYFPEQKRHWVPGIRVQSKPKL